MNATFSITPTQVDNILKDAAESADQAELNQLVRTLFSHYDFNRILPCELLRRAVKIVNKRHCLKIKLVE